MPGQRDRHAGCVGSHLVENDLFDFLLFSLPDNDTYSHRVGPENSPVSIAEADRALGRLMDAAGGTDEFLADHAVIVMSDHSQNQITDTISLANAVTGVRALLPSDPDPDEAEVALCPARAIGPGLRAGRGPRGSRTRWRRSWSRWKAWTW